MARQKALIDLHAVAAADQDGEPAGSVAELFGAQRPGAEVTLRRLRIFWAVAHSSSLTRAAKLLNVSQPTLSQQLTGFETAIGTPLFERRSNRMVLTETGEILLRKTEQVLRSAQELEDSLPTLGRQSRQTLRIAGISSVMRVILPLAMQDLASGAADVDLDVHENSPGEIIDLLYARRVNVGLMAANSVAEVSAGFQQIPILTDPFVLAVPEGIDLSGVSDLNRDLPASDRLVLNRAIQFVFGTQHSSRIQSWLDAAFPNNQLSVRVRSFELALDLVASGAGICVLPALTALVGGPPRAGVRLYSIGLEERRIVAMVPSHYLRVPHYGAFLAALQSAGQRIALPPVAPTPAFLQGLAREG
ncbi:MAG: LysR family transcriptional regulator [Paracoccaceae bacterium]